MFNAKQLAYLKENFAKKQGTSGLLYLSKVNKTVISEYGNENTANYNLLVDLTETGVQFIFNKDGIFRTTIKIKNVDELHHKMKHKLLLEHEQKMYKECEELFELAD